jgi:hypothetical protein
MRGVPNSAVGHALQCNVDGLIIMRHNEVSNVLADLGMKALTPSAVRDEPRIHPNSHKLEKSDQKLSENPVQHCKSKSNDEDRGDLLIRGLCKTEQTASSMSTSRISMQKVNSICPQTRFS